MNLKQLSIATFNLYNLNLPGRRIYTDANGWSQDEYALKIAWTAHNLKLLASDVFGFQELWHPDALTQALADSGLATDYDVLTEPGSSGSRIDCAALVKKGLLTGAPEWIADFPPRFRLDSGGDDAQTPAIRIGLTGFSRPVLHFAIKPRSALPEVHVYVCHLKSKAPTRVDKEPWFKADKALYKSKRNGRNCVTVWEQRRR